MEISRITQENKEQLEKLIYSIETTLSDRAFWLPINDVSREHFYDNRTEFIGMLDGELLIGAVAVFDNEHE